MRLNATPLLRNTLPYLRRWFDSAAPVAVSRPIEDRVDWVRVVPFIALHLACFSVIWVGFSAVAIYLACALYLLRMFAITAFYHRYFSHKAFRTSRWFQCVMAIWAGTAVQRGPLWWAATHRHHHVHSDQAEDSHSPVQHSFLWSHMGWFLSYENFATKTDRVRDFAQYPELRFLDRYDTLVPLLFALCLYGLGEWLQAAMPQLQTNGWQLLVWGFCISTVAVYHATFSVNSLCHAWGYRRYATRDHSRNNALVALLTLGEGWHNNHHHFPGAARQGFYWWEIDFTYYGLRVLQALGLIRELRAIPAQLRDSRRIVPIVKQDAAV